jgi:hypothetical protein
MTRFTVTIDADLDDQRNIYTSGAIPNMGDAFLRGWIKPGVDVHVELSTGDVVHGTLITMSVQAESATT